jgi:hypothetical protein
MGQVAERNSFRTDFVWLLHLSIIAFFTAGWLVFILIMAASGERILRDGFDFFMVFIFPLIFGTFLSVIAVALSNVLRQKWWIALFGTIILLGTPLIAWVITWIGKQIARFIYLATPSDLERTILVLNMKVKPRKEMEIGNYDFDSVPLMETLALEKEGKTESSKAPKTQIEAKKSKHVLPRFYGLWQCGIAALFGGVFAGGLLLSLNYKQFQERRNYIIGIVVSFVGQFALLILLIGLSYSDTSALAIIPIVLGVFISVILWYSELQQEDIEAVNYAKESEPHSWWMVIGIIILSWIFVAIFNPLAEEIVWALDMPFM